MMNLNQLYETGYLLFNLKDYDNRVYNFLKKEIKNQDFIEEIDSCRVDLILENISEKTLVTILNNNFFTKESAFIEKQPDGLIFLSINTLTAFSDYRNLLSDLSPYIHRNINTCSFSNINSKNNQFATQIKLIFSKILDELYYGEIDIDKNQLNVIDLCILSQNNQAEEHGDGNISGRLCSITLFVNETYKEEFGSELILENDVKIKPEFGMVLIMDLKKNNLNYKITKNNSKDFLRTSLSKFIYDNVSKPIL